MKTTKIQIKDIHGSIIFEYECEENSIKKTVEMAVSKGVNLKEADFSCADLSGATLSDTDLSSANLRGTDLRGATLSGSDLSYADISNADLRNADLRSVYLCYASLYWAILGRANLRGANLRGANLYGADLCGANLRKAYLGYAENIPYIPLECPSDGTFTGWKKIYGCIVELEIPADAKRSSATTRKCRCSKAKVISIKGKYDGTDIEEIVNTNYAETTYKVGEMVYPDSFDEDRWNECSHGIHFFINKQDAINFSW